MKTPQVFGGKEARQMAPGRSHVAVLLALLAAWPTISLATPAAAGELACGTARPTGCEAWTTLFVDGDTQRPLVATTPDGAGVIVAANNAVPGMYRFIINAYDPQTGVLLWNTTYALGNAPVITAMAASPDGSTLYIVGSTNGTHPQQTQALALAYDTHDGAFLWSREWEPGSRAYALARSLDGSRIFLTGWKHANFLTAALDAQTGQIVWEQSYDNHGGKAPDVPFSSEDKGYAIAASLPGDAVFVVGHSAAADGTLEYATVKYDAATGAQAWVQRHRAEGLFGPTHAGAYELVPSPDGARLYVAGSDGLLAYDSATGAPLWPAPARDAICRRFWSANLHEGECDLAISPDGARLVVATHNDLAAYDADGALLWNLPLSVGDEDKKQGSNVGNDMAMSPDGSRVYVTSMGGRDPELTSNTGAINSNFETLAIDAAKGVLLWRVVYDRAWDAAPTLAISPGGGRLFVTGESSIGLPSDMALLAYDTDLGLENLPTLTI